MTRTAPARSAAARSAAARTGTARTASALPLALGADDLPEAELRAMRLDGQVYMLAESWCPVDVPETPRSRARAVMTGRSPRLIAGLMTAAWIWSAVPRLRWPISVCADVRARARLGPGSDAVVSELVLDDGDVVELEGVRVTTPVRTMLDLARRDADPTALRGLARVARLDARAAVALLDGRRAPGDRIAARALASALDDASAEDRLRTGAQP